MYNYFVWDSGLGPGPYSFRVTDEYGQVLTDTGIAFVEAGDRAGARQFPRCQ
jgi:expansin (peptidoglycan-binding protein)